MSVILCHGAGSPNQNRIRNGSFEAHADGWFPVTADTMPSFSPGVSRTATGGALSVDKASGTAMVRHRQDGFLLADLSGLAVFDAVVYAMSGNEAATAQLLVSIYDNPYAVGAVLDAFESAVVPLSGDGWAEIALRDRAVPVGGTHASIIVAITDTDGTPVFLDDAYFGEPDGEAPPYAGRAFVFADNRVPNGAFETDIVPWDLFWSTETIVRDTVSPITGSGSLKVTTTGDPDGTEGTVLGYQVGVLPGEAIRWTFTVKGAGDLQAAMYFHGAVSPERQVWTGTATGLPQAVAVDETVPAGAFALSLSIFTDGAQTVTFWLDDVSLGTPQD